MAPKRHADDALPRQSKRIRGISPEGRMPTRQSKRLRGQSAVTWVLEPVRRRAAAVGVRAEGKVGNGKSVTGWNGGAVKELEEVLARMKPRSCFLSLAAELRNKVYVYTLLERTRIDITPRLTQPGILTACRQTRAEAKQMWLYQNKFEFTAVDNDARVIFRFQRIDQQGLRGGLDLRINHSGRFHWGNLMQWCKDISRHGRYAFRSAGYTRGHMVIAAATAMALRNYRYRWRDVEGQLQIWRALAGAVNREWLVDYGLWN